MLTYGLGAYNKCLGKTFLYTQKISLLENDDDKIILGLYIYVHFPTLIIRNKNSIPKDFELQCSTVC